MDQKPLVVAVHSELEACFYAFLSTIPSSIVLPSHLANFDEFQKLETAVAIKALYEVAISPQQRPDVLNSIWLLMQQVVKASKKNIDRESYQKIMMVAAAVSAVTGAKFDPIAVFIDEVSKFLVFANPLSDNTSSNKVDAKDVIKKLLDIVQKASALYYKNAAQQNKDHLKRCLVPLCPNLLATLGLALNIIIKNPGAKDYASSLEIARSSLKAMQETKGINTLFGDKFLTALIDHKQIVLYIQKFDEFLACDFSKPIGEKQEGKILEWLGILSKMSVDVLESRVKDAFGYHYQINTILANKNNRTSFKSKVLEYYEIFKRDLVKYAQEFKFEDMNKRSVLLAIFGVIFLDTDTYHGYDRNTKFQLQISGKKKLTEAKENIDEYLCFYIEVLNYTQFFQDKELDSKTKEVKRLFDKLSDLQKMDDRGVHYLMQESAEKLLQYFVKTTVIPVSSLAHFEHDEPIEKLVLLKKDPYKVLLYLTELKNLYNSFLSVIQKSSPRADENQACGDFIQRLKQEEDRAKQQLEVIEKACEKKLNPLIAETISVVIPYFRLNALGYVETRAKDYIQKYCYRAKLRVAFEALSKHFPNMVLNEPKTWLDLLRAVFPDEKMESVRRVLIFIVGVSYHEKKEYDTARKFYSYCLENGIFEVLSRENRGVYLINKDLILAYMTACDKKIFPENPTPIESGSPSAIPCVFTQERARKNSDVVDKADAEILSTANQNSFS